MWKMNSSKNIFLNLTAGSEILVDSSIIGKAIKDMKTKKASALSWVTNTIDNCCKNKRDM